MTWLMAIIYPIVVILIIDEVKVYEYFTKPAYAFQLLGEKIMALHTVDIIILASGLVGAIISGISDEAIKKTRISNVLKKRCATSRFCLKHTVFRALPGVS